MRKSTTVRYELHCNGEVTSSQYLNPLKAKARNQGCYFEIYIVYSPKTEFTSGNQRLTVQDFREIQRMNERGIRTADIARQFGVSKDYVRKILRSLNTNQTINSHESL